MSEYWKVLPVGEGKYMISNYGNFCYTETMEDGKPDYILDRKCANIMEIVVKGEKKIIEINRAVQKLFGLPCGDIAECKNLVCAKCGHNPEVYKHRLKRLRSEGFSTDADTGLKRLELHEGL